MNQSHQTPRFKKALLPAALIGATAALIACGGGSSKGPIVYPSDPQPTQPPSTVPAVSAQVAVEFINTATNQRITDPLTVTVTPVSSTETAKAIDVTGASIQGRTLAVTDGLLSFGVQNAATTTEFLVQAENPAQGWIKSGIKISGTTSRTLQLRLIKNDASTAQTINADTNTAISMAVQQVSSLSVGGTLTTPAKEITTPSGQKVPAGTTSISIPVGVTALDPVTNQPIAVTGPIKVSTTRFGTSEPDALAAFPGGFAITAEEASTQGGAVSGPQNFITGGFAQFNITDTAGNRLSKFDKPLAVSIDLPKGYTDPAGKVLAVGDTFPVWSYDNVTGKWTFEKNGTIAEKSPVDPNFYAVHFETNHLSWWNLDYRGDQCAGGTGLFKLKGRTDNRPLEVRVFVVSPNAKFPGQTYTERLHNAYVTDSIAEFTAAPARLVNIEIRDPSDQNRIVVSRQGFDLCNGPREIDLTNVGLKPLPSTTFNIRVEESCANGTQTRQVQTWAKAAISGDPGAYFAVQTPATHTVTRTYGKPLVIDVRGQGYTNASGKKFTEYFDRRSVTPVIGQVNEVVFKRTMACSGVTGSTSTNP